MEKRIAVEELAVACGEWLAGSEREWLNVKWGGSVVDLVKAPGGAKRRTGENVGDE